MRSRFLVPPPWSAEQEPKTRPRHSQQQKISCGSYYLGRRRVLCRESTSRTVDINSLMAPPLSKTHVGFTAEVILASLSSLLDIATGTIQSPMETSQIDSPNIHRAAVERCICISRFQDLPPRCHSRPADNDGSSATGLCAADLSGVSVKERLVM